MVSSFNVVLVSVWGWVMLIIFFVVFSVWFFFDSLYSSWWYDFILVVIVGILVVKFFSNISGKVLLMLESIISLILGMSLLIFWKLRNLILFVRFRLLVIVWYLLV